LREKQRLHVEEARGRLVKEVFRKAIPTQVAPPDDVRPPRIVAYGMGVDSTAMLVGMVARGDRPDLVLFANTGAEKPETLAYKPVIDDYLQRNGFPPVVVVRHLPSEDTLERYSTLEGECLDNGKLPSIAYGPGKRTCSIKWKHDPQDAYCKTWDPFLWSYNAGLKATKLIGYDAGAADDKRARRAPLSNDDYVYEYPLRQWGWDRERCIREIQAVGLPVPMKSSCFFCSAMKPSEVYWLWNNHRDLCERIEALEATALPKLRDLRGLWSRMGASKYVPESMSEFIQWLREGRDVSAVLAHEHEGDEGICQEVLEGGVCPHDQTPDEEAVLEEDAPEEPPGGLQGVGPGLAPGPATPGLADPEEMGYEILEMS
jgi:hypothetical protein